MTQKGRNRAQPKHAYIYTRYHNNRHTTQHNPYKHVVQNAHCHCNYISHFRTHSMTQKSYRKHLPPQNTRHVLQTRKAFHPRINKFANV